MLARAPHMAHSGFGAAGAARYPNFPESGYSVTSVVDLFEIARYFSVTAPVLMIWWAVS
jgi:hypothetical protein